MSDISAQEEYGSDLHNPTSRHGDELATQRIDDGRTWNGWSQVRSSREERNLHLSEVDRVEVPEELFVIHDILLRFSLAFLWEIGPILHDPQGVLTLT